MRGLVVGAIFALAFATNAAACWPDDGPTLKGLVSADIVAKVKLTHVDDSNIPYALFTFDTALTYSGKEQSEWKVVWQRGLRSLSQPVPFVVGETLVVGLVSPDNCSRSILPCPRDASGAIYPQIKTHWCYAPASHAFRFNELIEAYIYTAIEARE